jgi:hypothetical protein
MNTNQGQTRTGWSLPIILSLTAVNTLINQRASIEPLPFCVTGAALLL